MKNRFFCFLIILFCPVIANSQIWDSLVIKTHPLRDGIALNPNICFEKILSKKMSVEAEFTYKNRDFTSGGDGFSYFPSTGFRVLLGIKKYFAKRRHIPKAWYFLGQVGYRDINLNNFSSGRDYNDKTISDDNEKDYEINFLFGREFSIYKNIISEFNIGWGVYYYDWHSKYLSGNSSSYTNGYRNEVSWQGNFFLNWTIGYLISKK